MKAVMGSRVGVAVKVGAGMDVAVAVARGVGVNVRVDPDAAVPERRAVVPGVQAASMMAMLATIKSVVLFIYIFPS